MYCNDFQYTDRRKKGFSKECDTLFAYVYIPIIVVRISNPRMREVRRMKMISRPGGVLGETSSVLNNYLFVKTIVYAPEGDLYKGIESLPQTLIFLFIYLCSPIS